MLSAIYRICIFKYFYEDRTSSASSDSFVHASVHAICSNAQPTVALVKGVLPECSVCEARGTKTTQVNIRLATVDHDRHTRAVASSPGHSQILLRSRGKKSGSGLVWWTAYYYDLCITINEFCMFSLFGCFCRLGCCGVHVLVNTSFLYRIGQVHKFAGFLCLCITFRLCQYLIFILWFSC